MKKEDLDFFNKIAPQWDSMEIRSTPERIRHILRSTGLKPNMYVADLGTGTGVLLPYLAEFIGNDRFITAIDASKTMLEIAIEKYHEDYPGISFVNRDFEEATIKGKFDRIFLYCVYPHLQYPIQTLRRILENNLHPDGEIIIAFPNDEKFVNSIHHDKGCDADLLPTAPELALRLFEAGFKAKVIEYTQEAYIITIKH